MIIEEIGDFFKWFEQIMIFFLEKIEHVKILWVKNTFWNIMGNETNNFKSK